MNGPNTYAVFATIFRSPMMTSPSMTAAVSANAIHQPAVAFINISSLVSGDADYVTLAASSNPGSNVVLTLKAASLFYVSDL